MSAAAASPESVARCHARDLTPFPPSIIISILLRRLEPEATPATPATRQPEQKRTTFKIPAA
jgi:hypothetical protein